MKKGVLIGVIVGVVALILVAGFFVLTNNEGNGSLEENADPNQMVDCGMMTNPSCLSNRMNECLPVTGKMMGSDGTTSIEMIILGVENETCHFQRKINDVLNMDCYFPGGALNWDLIDQTFGNDKGLQSVVDSSCKNV